MQNLFSGIPISLVVPKVNDAHDVELNWEQIKLKEKGGNKTVLSGVPAALPSIIKAYRIQERRPILDLIGKQRGCLE